MRKIELGHHFIGDTFKKIKLNITVAEFYIRQMVKKYINTIINMVCHLNKHLRFPYE